MLHELRKCNYFDQKILCIEDFKERAGSEYLNSYLFHVNLYVEIFCSGMIIIFVSLKMTFSYLKICCRFYLIFHFNNLFSRLEFVIVAFPVVLVDKCGQMWSIANIENLKTVIRWIFNRKIFVIFFSILYQLQMRNKLKFIKLPSVLRFNLTLIYSSPVQNSQG